MNRKNSRSKGDVLKEKAPFILAKTTTASPPQIVDDFLLHRWHVARTQCLLVTCKKSSSALSSFCHVFSKCRTQLRNSSREQHQCDQHYYFLCSAFSGGDGVMETLFTIHLLHQQYLYKAKHQVVPHEKKDVLLSEVPFSFFPLRFSF